MTNTTVKYKITYNGYTIKFLESYDEVIEFIEEILEEHKDLHPVEIYRGYAAENQASNPSKTIKGVIIFQYNTIYTEVFMIEERN